MEKIERRLTLLWAVMIALTLLSYAASEGGRGETSLAIASVVVAAFVKVRFVILDFMEIRLAPLACRILLEVWLVSIATILIILFNSSSYKL